MRALPRGRTCAASPSAHAPTDDGPHAARHGLAHARGRLAALAPPGTTSAFSSTCPDLAAQPAHSGRRTGTPALAKPVGRAIPGPRTPRSATELEHRADPVLRLHQLEGRG